MSLLDKEAVKRVEKFLLKFDKNHKILVLKNSARTASEAASSLGCEAGAIIKSLLFKTKNNFILCLVAGDKRASLTYRLCGKMHRFSREEKGKKNHIIRGGVIVLQYLYSILVTLFTV